MLTSRPEDLSNELQKLEPAQVLAFGILHPDHDSLIAGALHGKLEPAQVSTWCQSENLNLREEAESLRWLKSDKSVKHISLTLPTA